jgi:hypothetical protein
MPRRTRPALAAAAAVLALTAVPLAVAPAAHATATPKSVAAMAALMPPIGAEVPSSMLALNSQVRIGQDVYSVDFRGGIRQRVDVDPDNPLVSVRLRTVGFRATAELPDGGTITLEQSDVDVSAESRLTQTQQFPPRYTERDVIPVTATVELPGQDPMVLQGIDSLVLKNDKLTQFPTRGDLFTLEAPVNFAEPDSPDTVVATLQTFSAQRGGL